MGPASATGAPLTGLTTTLTVSVAIPPSLSVTVKLNTNTSTLVNTGDVNVAILLVALVRGRIFVPLICCHSTLTVPSESDEIPVNVTPVFSFTDISNPAFAVGNALTGNTVTLTVSVTVVPSLSVTAKLNSKVSGVVSTGASNVVFKILGLSMATELVPLTCVHTTLAIVPSLSDATPERFTTVPSGIDWLAPAFTVGTKLIGFTVTKTESLATAPSSSVTEKLNSRTSLLITAGAVKPVLFELALVNVLLTSIPSTCCHNTVTVPSLSLPVPVRLTDNCSLTV